MADFSFDLFRLNIRDDETLLGFMGEPIRTDFEIRDVLLEATKPIYDVTRDNPNSVHKMELAVFHGS
jgi:hypothetical protein